MRYVSARPMMTFEAMLTLLYGLYLIQDADRMFTTNIASAAGRPVYSEAVGGSDMLLLQLLLYKLSQTEQEDLPKEKR